jgi:Flp pilus assembly pilin Flp
MLETWARHFLGDESGQNMVETALIIGVVSLVIVFAFLTTDITTGIGNLSRQVACEVDGGVWSDVADTCAGA